MKPRFVPPFLKKGHGETDASPAKRAKTAEQEQDTKPQASGLRLGLSRSRVNSVRRKPFLTMANPIATAAAHVSSSAADERHFTVVWRKPTNKKHKSWDGDGIVSIVGGHCTLQDMSGKEIGTGKLQTIGSLEPGDEMRVGSKEIELQDVLSRDDYMSGKMFLKNAVAAPATDYTSQMHVKHASLPQPRHDPNGPNALVLSRPNPRDTRGPIVDVVVDPFLAKHLRPHQREGISFLYDCVMKIKSYDGQGAILADDMGLGKTLQTIALLWTLLKQNPIPHQGPIVRKALVVCPVSLMMNWKKEFKKWLGEARIGVYIVDNKANLRDFVCGKVYSVMIIGYERIRQVQENDELKNANFDIVICDEGHRLKTSQNKSAQAIRSIKTARRIILSGTPIQNDLGEFFVMIDFVNPGLLGTYNTFKKTFENPIVKARQPEASQREKEKGQARSNELTRLTDMFILRRTSDLLLHTLPPKTECVVFCRPTELQMTLHKRMAESPALERCLRGDNSAARLGAIIQLRKICNSPMTSFCKNRSRTSSLPDCRAAMG